MAAQDAALLKGDANELVDSVSRKPDVNNDYDAADSDVDDQPSPSSTVGSSRNSRHHIIHDQSENEKRLSAQFAEGQ